MATAVGVTPGQEQRLRDHIRGARALEGLEYGPLGETIVPRSTILNYSLIPLEGLSAPLKRIAYRANSLMDPYFFGTVILRRDQFSKNPIKAQNLHYVMFLIVLKDSLKEGIEIPRDHLKTTIYVEVYAMWRALPFGPREEDFFSNLGYTDLYVEWMRRAHSQDIKILVVSETIKNAIKLGTRISNHYENNQIFRELFFDILPTEKEIWTAESMHQRRSPQATGHGEGTFDFIGVGAALQSRHYNLCIQDDLVGREARKSPIVMADTIDYHQVLVGATHNDPDNPGRDFDEIVVGNRWSYNDLNSHIRREEPYFSFTTHSALGGCCSLHSANKPIYPEAFTIEKLLRWKRRLGTYHFSCFAAGTPILMADLSEKFIEEIQVGEEVVGYTTSGYMTMQKATVEGVNIRKATICEFTTASGRKFRCTPDHQFLKTSHRDPERGGPYGPIIDMNRRGDLFAELASVYTPPTDPTPEEQRDLDWLGGILDGEGSCGVSGQVLVSQSPVVNPEVHAGITACLDRLRIPWSYINASKQITIQGGKSLKVRLLKHSRMVKRQRFIDGWWIKPGRVMEDGGCDQIIDAAIIGEMDVYNIQTTTGNYVAAGYATKNCQFLNLPIDPSKAKFNLKDFRYFNFHKLSGDAFSIPKDLPWWKIKGLPPTAMASAAGGAQYRWVIRHHVSEGDVEHDVFPRYLDRYLITDPRHSGEEEATESGVGSRCRHAAIAVGISSSPRRIYLLDQWASACDTKTYIEKLLFLALKWKVRRIHCEDVASQKFLIHHFNYFLQVERARNPELEGLRMVPIKLKGNQRQDSKFERIDNAIPIVERHELWLNVDNCDDFKEEAERYGQSRTTVDLLDCFGYVPYVAPQDGVDEEMIVEFMDKQKAALRRRMGAVA